MTPNAATSAAAHGPDDENCGDVDAGQEAEAMGVARIRRAVVARDLNELGQHHGCAEESQGGVRRARCFNDSDGEDRGPGRHSADYQAARLQLDARYVEHVGSADGASPTSCRRLRPAEVQQEVRTEESSSRRAAFLVPPCWNPEKSMGASSVPGIPRRGEFSGVRACKNSRAARKPPSRDPGEIRSRQIFGSPRCPTHPSFEGRACQHRPAPATQTSCVS